MLTQFAIKKLIESIMEEHPWCTFADIHVSKGHVDISITEVIPTQDLPEEE